MLSGTHFERVPSAKKGRTMRIHDFLSYWALNAPDRICVDDGSTSLTYSDVEHQAIRFAAALTGSGVRRGDRIALLAKNSAHWASLYYGAFKAGAVPVPLNVRLHPREWSYQLQDSAARVVVAGPEYTAGIDSVRAEVQAEKFISIGGPSEGWESLQSLLDAAAVCDLMVEDIEGDAELYQMYTSGTTGRPKGAVITHDAAMANLTQIRTFLPLYQGEGALLVAPLFHAAAAVSLFWYIACGATIHMRPDFSPQDSLQILADGNIATATFVPAMISMIVRLPEAAKREYPGLRNVVYGASPIGEKTLRRALELFDCDIVQGYGQTECCSTLTFLGPEEHRRALAGEDHLLLSCGRPVVGTTIRICDSNGRALPAGEVGEILARGPQVMRGYWNLPEATAATLADGWLHTGDAGYFDENGYLYISDRVKDLIVSGGENVYPREIEDAITNHPGVTESAVIGVPDEKWGETVKAIVVKTQDVTLTADDVIDHCREQLAGFKVPRSVDFVDSLPRNATGKVLKTELREPYWRGHTRRVGG